MKKGWETKRLEEVCEILDSQRRPITKRDRTAGRYPYYGATGIVDYVNSYIFDEPLVLIGEDGAKWRSGEETAFTIQGKCWVNNHAHVLRPYRKTVIDNWLVHYLNHSDLTVFVSGLTVPKLNQGNLREINIPVPPLPEQRRIVGLLDEAFAAIATAKANAEKNLQNAREIFESHLNDVFTKKGDGWVEKRLGEICAFRNGINYTKESRGERIKIVGVRNFQRNFSVPQNDLDEVTIDGVLDDLDLLKPGDLLAVRSNGNVELIGRTLFADKIVGRMSHSGFTIRIRLSSQNVLPKYLCYFMKSPRTRTRLADGGTGTNIKSLNQGMLSALKIPLPPNGVQKSIVAQLDALSAETQRLAAIYSRKLAALEELKQALLHQAFSGEV